VNSIKSSSAPLVSGVDGLEALTLADAAGESRRLGRPVTL